MTKTFYYHKILASDQLTVFFKKKQTNQKTPETFLTDLKTKKNNINSNVTQTLTTKCQQIEHPRGSRRSEKMELSRVQQKTMGRST